MVFLKKVLLGLRFFSLFTYFQFWNLVLGKKGMDATHSELCCVFVQFLLDVHENKIIKTVLFLLP